MRTTLKWARASMAAVFFVATCVGDVHAADMSGKPGSQVGRDSVLRIPANAAFPLSKRIDLGVGRSIVVQFPVPLKDVLVSDPGVLDAVVQSSDRVFLIAKKTGQTNAFFFDEYGQQILTLEVAIGADLSSLDQLLTRLIPGSNIHSEIAGRAIVLTGTVRTPINSNMAAQIAAQFAAVNKDAASVTTGPSATSNTSSTTNIGIGSSDSSFQSLSNKSGGDSGGGDDVYAAKPIINLLSVEGEEQVMLRVSVAEVQRDMLKQFGINLGALVNSGNFTTAILSDNAFPLSAAAGLGILPVPGVTSGGLNVFSAGAAGIGFPSGAAAIPFVNSGVATAWRSGNQAVTGVLRALERDGLVKTLAEPNLTAVSGEPARFLAGGEFPVPVVDSLGQVSRALQGVRHRSRLHAGRPLRGAHQPEDRNRGERAHPTKAPSRSMAFRSLPSRQRQANSTVELPSGGSLALAGLLSEDSRQNIDGFPGLKDLPILGTLFRSKRLPEDRKPSSS